MKTYLFAAAGLILAATSAHAQDSMANLSKVSGDSVASTAELAEAGVKVVAGTVALPFIAAGTVAESGGRALREGGESVWDSANGPLDISPETVVPAQPAPQVPYDATRDDRRREGNDTQDDHGQ